MKWKETLLTALILSSPNAQAAWFSKGLKWAGDRTGLTQVTEEATGIAEARRTEEARAEARQAEGEVAAAAAEVDAIYKQLVEQGYRSHKEPWDAFWGQRDAQVLDPDSNPVDLFAPL